MIARRNPLEALAWVLDVEPEALEDTLARLGLPQRAWILSLGKVGWSGDPPPGAEVLAEEGLVDLEKRRTTKKGLAVLRLLEMLL